MSPLANLPAVDLTERIENTALVCLALCCLLSSCTQIEIAEPGAVAPQVAATQLGGMLTVELPGSDAEIRIDNRESWEDTTEMAKGITSTISILKGTLAAIDLRQAKNAAEAANQGAQIAAGTEAQRIAADQALQSQALTNEAAAAALAAP